MGIQEKAQSMMDQIPDSEMNKVGDYFEDVLRENNCVITDRYGTVIDWEMKPDHKEIKKILRKTRGRGATINSVEELNHKEKRLYEKRKHILSNRWKTKAQRRYFLSLAKRGKSND